MPVILVVAVFFGDWRRRSFVSDRPAEAAILTYLFSIDRTMNQSAGTHSSNAQAQAQAPHPTAASMAELKRRRSATKMPGEDMTIAETLRVMDVAREMREQRESAEEMFRHDEVRVRLREKLMRTAAMSGDRVTEAEIDAAIDQHLSGLHVYQGPPKGFQTFLAHCWVFRYRIAAATIALGAACSWMFL